MLDYQYHWKSIHYLQHLKREVANKEESVKSEEIIFQSNALNTEKSSAFRDLKKGKGSLGDSDRAFRKIGNVN